MFKHSFPRIFFYILCRLVNDFFIPPVNVSNKSYFPASFFSGAWKRAVLQKTRWVEMASGSFDPKKTAPETGLEGHQKTMVKSRSGHEPSS